MAAAGFAASAPFGADVLERLARTQEIAFLLTRPDRPAGRGQRLAPPPAKLAAERLGIRVLQPERLDEGVELPADTVVTCAYGAIVPPRLLARHLWLNVHPSLLPRWRGAAPVERAILAGDEETGVTIIRLTEELDAGPIAAQRAFSLGPDDDAGSVYERAAEIAASLLPAVLAEPEFRDQPADGVTYAEKLTAADRELDIDGSAEEALWRIRALSPHIGARAQLDGRPVTIWKARIEGGELVPEIVQPEGRRRMTYDEFRRGLRS
ncbi:MAG TPA: methionyl-tRNA formyltransferase [Gaiellaceae bacterium]|nr:methionyl-tRNA formyltransferase [Gaiellaceae bacterium]